MSIVDTSFRSVTCNGPDCSNTVTFEQRMGPTGPVPISPEILEANPWLKTARVVQAAGKVFFYCGDVCEVNSVSQGQHNPVEEKKIIEMPTGVGRAQIEAAARAAHEAEEGTKALKEGKPVTLHQA